jgi:hypothetical protein
MRKGNDILPTIHLMRRGNKVDRFNYTLRGKKRMLFFFLQLLSIVFGWGVLVYGAYKLFF